MSTGFVGASGGNTARPLAPVIAAHIVTDEAGRFSEAYTLSDYPGAVTVHYDTPLALVADFVVFSNRSKELLLYQADYDMRYLIPALEKLIADGFDVTFTMDKKCRIIFAKIRRSKHCWYIRDCSSMLPLDMQELRALARCDQDTPIVQVLIKAYARLATTLRDTFSVRPSVTVGTTAMHAWTTTLDEHHIFYRQRPTVEAFGREGYYGGLVWVQRQAEEANCTYIDCNAMYAHSMRQGVPVMSPTHTHHYYQGRPGMYLCDVYCPPDIPFAFVPKRRDFGPGVSYPRGEAFETVLTSTTIELAREKGYSIEIIEGYVFEKLGYVFDNFVDKCEILEQQYKTDGAQGVIKSLRNALAGKFGQRDEGREYYLTPTPAPDMCPCLAPMDGEIIDNLFYRFVHIDRPYMQPVWAAWITANARNMLVRAVYALGPKNCLYGDTDSIMVPASVLADNPTVTPFGTRYGEWKVKHQFVRFVPLGPKLYGGLTDQGEYIVVAAGVQKGVLTEADMEMLRPHGPPVATRVHRQQHRAIHTTGGRPIDEPIVKHVVVPELDARWMHETLA